MCENTNLDTIIPRRGPRVKTLGRLCLVSLVMLHPVQWIHQVGVANMWISTKQSRFFLLKSSNRWVLGVGSRDRVRWKAEVE